MSFMNCQVGKYRQSASVGRVFRVNGSLSAKSVALFSAALIVTIVTSGCTLFSKPASDPAVEMLHGLRLDSTLSETSRDGIIQKCDGVVEAMGYDPSWFTHVFYEDSLSQVVNYWPRDVREVWGNIVVEVGKQDWAVLKLARSRQFLVKDTTISNQVLSEILTVTDSVAQSSDPFLKFDGIVQTDDSLYSLTYTSDEALEDGLTSVWGQLVIILRKSDLSIVSENLFFMPIMHAVKTR